MTENGGLDWNVIYFQDQTADSTSLERRLSEGFGSNSNDIHDAAGNVTHNTAYTTPPNFRTWKFDAAGRMTEWREISPYVGDTR